jgi:Mn-dependent DtxR family transcriptional regulator
MTPAEQDATFIALWQQGLTTAAIAQRLDIPPGTARSRAYALQQRGLITARPRGGEAAVDLTPAGRHRVAALTASGG